MSRFLVLACCICAISANPMQKLIDTRLRIVFGDTIEIEDAPYQVSIILLANKFHGKHNCGGSILSKNLILTAGHCAKLEADKYVIRSGSSTWLSGGKLHKVVEIIRHDDYEKDIFDRATHDIAVMKVSPEFDLDGETEKVIELPDKDDEVKPGDDAYVTGWGITEQGMISRHLKGLDLKIMDFKNCTELYKHFGDMTKYNICAQHPGGMRDMCNGDSGGPLVVKGKQVGIASWSGPGCAIRGRPGVYTDVAKYRDWIDQQVESHYVNGTILNEEALLNI